MTGASSEDEAYEVDCILNTRIRRRKREFLIRWRDFPDGDTWEPTENLNGCQSLLDDFMENYLKSKANLQSNTKVKKKKPDTDSLLKEKRLTRSSSRSREMKPVSSSRSREMKPDKVNVIENSTFPQEENILKEIMLEDKENKFEDKIESKKIGDIFNTSDFIVQKKNIMSKVSLNPNGSSLQKEKSSNNKLQWISLKSLLFVIGLFFIGALISAIVTYKKEAMDIFSFSLK